MLMNDAERPLNKDGDLPWWNYALSIYYALPGYCLAVEMLRWVIGKVLQTDAYLAGTLCWFSTLAIYAV